MFNGSGFMVSFFYICFSGLYGLSFAESPGLSIDNDSPELLAEVDINENPPSELTIRQPLENSSTTSLSSALITICIFFLALLLIGAAFVYLNQWRRGRLWGRRSENCLHTIDMLQLGQGHAVVLIECQGHRYLLSVSRNSTQFLHAVPNGEDPAAGVSASENKV